MHYRCIGMLVVRWIHIISECARGTILLLSQQSNISMRRLFVNLSNLVKSFASLTKLTGWFASQLLCNFKSKYLPFIPKL